MSRISKCLDKGKKLYDEDIISLSEAILFEQNISPLL